MTLTAAQSSPDPEPDEPVVGGADSPAAGSLEAAIALARAAHSGQVDKLGGDYIDHPLGVMGLVHTVPEKIVAVLHDVVEDTSVTLDDLRAQGYAEPLVRAVDALTKRAGESLADSMARVAADPLALIVKHADLAHNANPARQAALPAETSERLTAKYEESARLLGTTLAAVLDR
ncbi:bifunctional (p)ppGpp synthetase/guanosine-3',5'-bis(diphosphate) 3'-pyrophosphohydrolase [Cryobacterium lactosi]|uniref:Bifunctional (P)ppGpp synthetase/guanosine-3',5'-bis(Diphosphate) 3'-pyrophosphohydrolase n=1 Tax=Cryobacterium lactosi TaxID=1259202 RepID=A0A4R9BRN1_9MICO|nr:bifunctional (p)ppGpp synthetase/guanosine-3',5'-bis(diphosphate) 3'-pyrophosphohydrolase [Cryobacterium lactosi]TFD88538.1 bifunctional (p)ppGpp synthetase/guanosine-3',5'-bis(diphosphate) 3'-pyrophosphohydrolase [Cryobacterium lactosi]